MEFLQLLLELLHLLQLGLDLARLKLVKFEGQQLLLQVCKLVVQLSLASWWGNGHFFLHLLGRGLGCRWLFGRAGHTKSLRWRQLNFTRVYILQTQLFPNLRPGSLTLFDTGLAGGSIHLLTGFKAGSEAVEQTGFDALDRLFVQVFLDLLFPGQFLQPGCQNLLILLSDLPHVSLVGCFDRGVRANDVVVDLLPAPVLTLAKVPSYEALDAIVKRPRHGIARGVCSLHVVLFDLVLLHRRTQQRDDVSVLKDLGHCSPVVVVLP
mmetsp:Transcript_18435/g.36096  ORF Transcript_18435/g.36096 Transcript_18435/m.36096 type:complete len:265 (+) Transcript_18435:570-1364(+)